MEGFQVEDLSPSKMVKLHSVLESMGILLVKGNEKWGSLRTKAVIVLL